jgi:4-alpha-glucanotransferase
VTYRDWQGRTVEVADDTLAAVLDALGETQAPPAPRAPASAVGPFPARRAWGFTVQLYSVRSRASWGHGDFRDLADLATWSARDHGADFVLVNPLHAAEPLPPVSNSPYLPMSRHYLSPLYLRIEDIPEYAGLTPADRARVDALGAPLRAANTLTDTGLTNTTLTDTALTDTALIDTALIDRDAVWTAKRAALELIHAVPLSPARRAELDAFRGREGDALRNWVAWCAIAEVHGPDQRRWPAELRDPRSPAVARFEADRAARERAEFHAWLQWLAAEQATAAQRAAREAGMRIGVVADLAVGTHPGGSDAWARPGVIVTGVSVGAPPDEFNQRGQDWTLPPWHPALAGEPLAELVAATIRYAGGLRIDHVMGLARLWWIPAGMQPDQGTYVRYDHELMGGVLAAGAARAGAITIGEDLGTVEPWLRDFLADRHILGTSMLWFERAADGSPLAPASWRRGCLATVGTHDMPPAAAFLSGEQVSIRAELGLLTRPEAAERAAAAVELEQFLALLAREGLLKAGNGEPSAAEFTTALYACLTRTPAVLIGVSLAEAAGERRPQNMPGTTDQYPNWRIPLSDETGRPLLLEDLPALACLASVTAAVRQESGGR